MNPVFWIHNFNEHEISVFEHDMYKECLDNSLSDVRFLEVIHMGI